MANPLSAGLGLRRKPDPCALVVFGASGDLTKRKLFPALYAARLSRPAARAVRGRRRRPHGAADASVPDRDAGGGQAARARSVPLRRVRVPRRRASGTSRRSSTTTPARIASATPWRTSTAPAGRAGNRLHYLAVPPQAFPTVVREIGERREREGWARVIVEKPFGHDLASARELSAVVQRWFREDEVFRIDHYLGKETVQNLMALRFANGIFEPIWNRQMVDHVQITVAESMGIEGRAGLLRARGRGPRHLPEPPPAAPRPDGDGAADRLHRGRGAEREGEGAARDAHARPRSRSSAASTGADGSRARRCRRTARRRASTRTR